MPTSENTSGAIASVSAGSLIDTTGTIPEQMAQVKLAIESGAISYMDAYSSVYGLMVVGLIYATVALIIRFTGSGWLKKNLTTSCNWSYDYHYWTWFSTSCYFKCRI